MSTKIKGELKVTFVEHMAGISSKNNRPYNFINVSNGIEKRAFSTNLTLEDTKQLSTGEEVTIQVVLDPWKPFNNSIESIV